LGVNGKKPLVFQGVRGCFTHLWDYNGIYSLSVELNGNTFIWIDNRSKNAVLVKLGDGNRIEALDGEWIKIQGNWYKRR
jgi:hypothetical protein